MAKTLSIEKTTTGFKKVYPNAPKELIEKQLTLENAFNKSQDRKNVLGIWWYNQQEDILEYSDKAQGHLDRKYFSLMDKAGENPEIYRGRVLLIDSITYLIIYSNPKRRKIHISTACNIFRRIEKKTSLNISSVIDDKGVMIYERKQLLR